MQAFFRGILERLRAEFNLETMGSHFAALLTNLVVGLLTFLAFYLAWWMLDRLARFVLRRTERVDATTASFIETALKYTVLAVGLVQALSAAGIDTAAVIASLGIAGLTIGFAARDALSNLISGLLIFWDRPFVIGDLVEVGGQYGRVDRITLRSTRVVTPDGRMLAVPNSSIINSTVASYTNFPHLRLDVDVTVGVTEDLQRARAVLLDLVRKDPAYMSDPPPRVIVTALNDYNVALQLQVWLADERQHIVKRSELREQIFYAFNEAGIEMPFETIQLTPLEVKARVEAPDRAA
ncbi:MAG: mechanosensitive ion channel family protein [Bacteroidetes bacterium]|nr:MAG: mechanosensitive ion channel family protein [Bacteroidota bacterium]